MATEVRQFANRITKTETFFCLTADKLQAITSHTTRIVLVPLDNTNFLIIMYYLQCN
jgi:hypothetical protein